ncbi:MAG: DMT family transporter [Acidimicrobiia bacterium]
MSQLLSLATAALYGVADFSGGLASRKMAVWGVVAWSQLIGVALLGLTLIIVDAPEISAGDIALGAVAGVLGLLGIASLYAALARGSMSIVSPITGSLAALLPVAAGLVLGEVLSNQQWVGVGCALAAVILVAWDRSASHAPASVIGLSALAAVWFAAFFILLDQTSADSGIWPLVAARSVSVPLAFVVALLRKSGTPPRRDVLPIVAFAGLADMAANITILLALQSGPLGVSAVIASLYPAFTVLAAILILKEHPNKLQWLGIAMALLAVVLLAV